MLEIEEKPIDKTIYTVQQLFPQWRHIKDALAAAVSRDIITFKEYYECLNRLEELGI